MITGDITTENAPTIGLEDSIAVAARSMKSANSNLVVVLQDDKVVGILTERDIALGCPVEGHLSWQCEVFRHMTIQPDIIGRDADIIDAAILMIEKGLDYLPVVSGNEVVGALTSNDVFEARETEASYAL